jgi:hypothetical protein
VSKVCASDDLRSILRLRLLGATALLLICLEGMILVGGLRLREKERTFRLVLFVFESSLPPLALDFDVEAVFSFGLTAKKPSIRPCCFELTAFVSFSHDLRTRSSLGARSVKLRRGKMVVIAYMNPLSRTRKSTSPSTSGSFQSSFGECQNHRNGTVQTSTYINLVCGGNIRVLEEFLRLFPWPFFRYLDATPFFLPLLGLVILFGSGSMSPT